MSSSRPIIIKYGGSLLEDPPHRQDFLRDIAALAKKEKIVLVHGGGREITKALEKSGLATRFVGGRRFTDEATMAVVKEVLSKLNAEIVSQLTELGVPARGFSGQDHHLLEATPIAELGRVGHPRSVDVDAFQRVLQDGLLPVFYSIGEDAAGRPLNINADDFALALAVASRAKRLVYLTDSGAILDSKRTPLKVLSPTHVRLLIERQIITGGMVVKAQACVKALGEGVGRVDICKGIQALLSDDAEVEGTSFVHDETEQN